MSEENKKNNLDDTLDWEYMSDFYTEGEREVRSFEEIQAEDVKKKDSSDDQILGDQASDELKKVLEDVKEVKRLNDDGKRVAEIAEILSLDVDYVTNILMTVNCNTEDTSDLAVAQLILLG